MAEIPPTLKRIAQAWARYLTKATNATTTNGRKRKPLISRLLLLLLLPQSILMAAVAVA